MLLLKEIELAKGNVKTALTNRRISK